MKPDTDIMEFAEEIIDAPTGHFDKFTKSDLRKLYDKAKEFQAACCTLNQWLAQEKEGEKV